MSAAPGRGQYRYWPATTSGCWPAASSPGPGWSPAGQRRAQEHHHPLTRSLAGGAGLPRLEASRLRSTWLPECAQLLGLATFMHAAGITCSQRLGDLLAALEPGR